MISGKKEKKLYNPWKKKVLSLSGVGEYLDSYVEILSSIYI